MIISILQIRKLSVKGTKWEYTAIKWWGLQSEPGHVAPESSLLITVFHYLWREANFR